MNWRLATTTGVIALMAASGAAAQSQPAPAAPRETAASENTVGDVVVVARRREERLRDVPAAASVVDASEIAARGGVTDPERLLAGIPGVRYLNTNSPTTAETSVRASGTSRGTFAESAIGLYRDGVYVGGGLLGGRNFTRADLFDIERAEVVRGTQSALYGRNAVGGAINIITRAPQMEQSGFIDAKYGVNNEQWVAQGVVNLPVTSNFALRLGAQVFDQDGGFFYNNTRGEYFDREEGHVGRAQARYEGDRLTANFLIENQVARLPALHWQTTIAPNANFPQGYISEQRAYNWNSPSNAKQQVNTAILTIDYDLGWGQLTSTSSVRNRLTRNSFDSDTIDDATLAIIRGQGGGGAVDPNTAQMSQDDVTTYYQDIRIAGAPGGALDWFIGLEALRIENDYDQSNFRTPTMANPSTGTEQPAEQQIDSAAVYGSATWRLTERFRLGVEARYAEDRKDFYTERFDLRTGASAGPRFTIDDTLNTNNFTYNLIASYHFDDWLAYAKVGTAYRTGGYNRDLGDPRAPQPVVPGFDDERATTYEIGLKGNLSRSFYIEGAAYWTETEDLLVQLNNGCSLQNIACPVMATSFMVNAGEGESWGIEAFAHGRFSVGPGVLSIGAGGSRQGGEIVSGPFMGSDFPQVPDWVASANVNYRMPFIAGVDLVGNVAYRAQWGGIQEITGTPELSDFQQADVRVALDFGELEFAVYANNVTNSTYINFANAAARRWSQPRVYGVQVRRAW